MNMEAVVTDNGVNLKHNGLMETKPEKEKPVKPTSLSSGSDTEEEEEERSVGSLKRVSNKKRKRSIADEGRVAKTKSSREKRAAKRRKEKINGDEKKLKQRSSVKRRAKTKKEDKEREQELKLVPFIEPTDAGNSSDSDSHVKNENFKDCRSMTRSLRVTTLFLHYLIIVLSEIHCVLSSLPLYTGCFGRTCDLPSMLQRRKKISFHLHFL